MINNALSKNMLTLIVAGLILLTSVVGLRLGYNTYKNNFINETIAQAGNKRAPALSPRYSTIDTAQIALTGNTLMLSPSKESVLTTAPLDYGAIFTSLDSNTSAKNYPKGTTANWRQNGSTARLEFPQSSEVLFAMVSWSGSYLSTHDSTVSEEQNINTPVTLSLPQPSVNTTELIRPDPDYSYKYTKELTLRNLKAGQYHNTQDITKIVRTNGPGEYALSGIPAIIDTPSSNLKNELMAPESFAGWNIIIAYKNTDLPVRSLSILTGIQPALTQEANQSPLLLNQLPDQKTLPRSAQLFLAANEGDSHLYGDQILLGGTRNILSPVGGQFNQKGNFFASQINNHKGLTDSHGTFANKNQIIGISQHLKRQGHDITTLDVTQNFANPESRVELLPISNADGYNLNVIGFAMEVDSAAVGVKQVFSRDKVLLTLENSGNIKADKISLQVPLESGINLSNAIKQLSNYPADKLTLTEQELVLNDLPPDSSFTLELQNDLTSSKNLIFPLTYWYSQYDKSVIPIYKELVYSKPLAPNEPLSVAENIAPRVYDDISFTTINTAVTTDVLKNDHDEDGYLNQKSLKIARGSKNGEVSVVENSITYTPKEGFSGQDSFVYDVCDNKKSCHTAKVVVCVESPDDRSSSSSKPSSSSHTANNISKVFSLKNVLISRLKSSLTRFDFSNINVNAQVNSNNDQILSQPLNADTTIVISGGDVNIDVLSNDSILDKTSTIIKITKPPDNGVVAIKNSQLVYKSASNFVGTDYLIYSVCDESGFCNTAPVTITVGNKNQNSGIKDIQIPKTFSKLEFSTTMLAGFFVILILFLAYSIHMYRRENKH